MEWYMLDYNYWLLFFLIESICRRQLVLISSMRSPCVALQECNTYISEVPCRQCRNTKVEIVFKGDFHCFGTSVDSILYSWQVLSVQILLFARDKKQHRWAGSDSIIMDAQEKQRLQVCCKNGSLKTIFESILKFLAYTRYDCRTVPMRYRQNSWYSGEMPQDRV